VKLTKEKIALVDTEDAALLKLRWYAQNNGHSWYAYRGRNPPTGMHRTIMERVLARSLSKNEVVDHINFDTLDNRRSNLRIVSAQGSSCHRRKRNDAIRSRFKGVTLQNNRVGGKNWQASIGDKSLGYFKIEEDAARAYDKAAREVYGELAVLNFEGE
jgi:hypothetical protein